MIIMQNSVFYAHVFFLVKTGVYSGGLAWAYYRLSPQLDQQSLDRNEDNKAYGILEHLIDTHNIYKHYKDRRKNIDQTKTTSTKKL